MKLHPYSGLLLIAAVLSITCSEFLPKEIVNKHKLAKRSADELEEELPFPRHVIPNSYKLELQPFLHEAHFRGKVEINISCHEPSDSIILHAHDDLQVVLVDSAIHSIGLWDEFTGRSTFKQIGTSHHYERIPAKYVPHSAAITKIRRDSNKDLYEIVLKDKLKKGMMYLVKLEFLGNITQKGRTGLRQKSYTDSITKEERKYVIANLEKKGARKIFPCFDDPTFKASIQLSLALPSSLKAISTMPLQSTEPIEFQYGWKMDHFAPSPPMAAQSLAVMIFDPTQIEPIMKDGVHDVMIYGYGRASSRRAYPSKMKEIVSHFYMLQKFLGINFPLPELNLVVIPSDGDDWHKNDYWGLITIGEDSFISESFFSTPHFLLTEQWLGHMVTPDPQTEDLLTGLQIQLASNSLIYTTSYKEFIDPSLLWSTYLAPEVYNSILHSRSGVKIFQTAWMWRMLNDSLGPETFRLGIHSFMHEKAFKTFNEDDIFEALNNQAWLDDVLPLTISVRDIAKSWIDERRFPIVTVIRNYEDDSALVHQHALLQNDEENQIEEIRHSLFWIPVMYVTGENLDNRPVRLAAWMKERERIINDLGAQDTFIIVNPDHVGMYLVNYDLTNWCLLSQYLLDSAVDQNMTAIPAGTRSKLLYDAAKLAMVGELDFSMALNMTLFLQYERDPNIWVIMSEIVHSLARLIHDTPVYDKFLSYCKFLYVPAYNYSSNMQLKGEFRELFMESVDTVTAEVGYEPALAESKQEFRRVLANNSMPYSRNLCGILRWSDDDWELALQFILSTVPTNETSDENYFAQLVWCTRKPQNLNRILYLLFIDNSYEFSDKDVKDIIYAIHDYDTLLTFILDHWNEVKARLGDNPQLWNKLFEDGTKKVKTEQGLTLVSQLYDKHHTELGSAKSIVEKSLMHIQENLNRKYKYVNQIDSWLDTHLPYLS